MFDELTKVDIQKMKEELEYRITVVRPEILEDVKLARSHGDLSENAEYHAAKRERGKNESRIRYLRNMIKTAIVIDAESGEDEVGLFDTVTYYVEEDDCEEEVKIVRTKKFDIKPMYPEDACIQMELLGHSFFVFCNAETDQVNVVYKRKGDTYGLIEPED